MRKKTGIIILSGILFLGGCTSAQREEGQEPLRTVIFYPNTAEEEEQNIVKGIAKAAQEALDGKEQVLFSVYEIRKEQYTSMEYKVDAAAAMMPDVVILGGADPSHSAEEYRKLVDNEIHFLLIDGDHKDSGRDAYIGIDNEQAGEMGAKFISQQLSPKSKVGIISPILPESVGNELIPASLVQRYQGFCRQLEQYEMIAIPAECECTLDNFSALQKVTEFLEQNQEIDVLFCTDSVSGAAAANAVKNLDMGAQVKIICFDLTNQIVSGIKEGIIEAAIIQDTRAIGEACANLLCEMQDGRVLTGEDSILVDCQIVTTENLEDYL